MFRASWRGKTCTRGIKGLALPNARVLGLEPLGSGQKPFGHGTNQKLNALTL